MSTEEQSKVSFSVIVPVLNEAEHINALIEHILSVKAGWRVEIIVVDGDSQGSTIGVILGKDTITAVSQRGRAKQMNAGARLAKSDILVFLHADTRLPTDAFRPMSRVLNNDRYVAGAFDLDIDSGSVLIKAIAFMGRIRSRLTRVPYGDQAVFIRRNYFEEIRGFRDISFLEDVEMMRRIKKRGDRICILTQRIKTSARRWEKEGIFYTTLRNLFVLALYYLGASPDRLAKYYWSTHDVRTEEEGKTEAADINCCCR